MPEPGGIRAGGYSGPGILGHLHVPLEEPPLYRPFCPHPATLGPRDKICQRILPVSGPAPSGTVDRI